MTKPKDIRKPQLGDVVRVNAGHWQGYKGVIIGLSLNQLSQKVLYSLAFKKDTPRFDGFREDEIVLIKPFNGIIDWDDIFISSSGEAE